MWLINLSQYDDYGFVLFSTLGKAQNYSRTFNTSEPEEVEIDPDFVALPGNKMVFEARGTIRGFPAYTIQKTFNPDKEYPDVHVLNTYRTILNPAGVREEIPVGYTMDSSIWIEVIAESLEAAKIQAKHVLSKWLTKNQIKILGTEQEIDDFIAEWNNRWLDDITKKMGF